MVCKIGKVLIEKLTPEELTELCDSHENGSLDEIFYNDLYPVDEKNHPEKYVNPDEGDGIEGPN